MKISDPKAHNASRREALWAFRSAIFTIFIGGIESDKYVGSPLQIWLFWGSQPEKFGNPCSRRSRPYTGLPRPDPLHLQNSTEDGFYEEGELKMKSKSAVMLLFIFLLHYNSHSYLWNYVPGGEEAVWWGLEISRVVHQHREWAFSGAELCTNLRGVHRNAQAHVRGADGPIWASQSCFKYFY